MESYEEIEIEIGDIEHLLENYDVEIDSPDGYVPVSKFVDKGMWDEYVVDYADKSISVNENHLFETQDGWVLTKDMVGKPYQVLTENGEYVDVTVKKGDAQIPIVDIQVEHENHRYYADGLSSHNTNVGKSALMCFLAGELVKAGKNVLYVSAEMSEEALYERNDANLLDVTTDQLKNPDLDKKWFMSKLQSLQQKGAGRYIAKEYPTSSAHAGHIKHLLKELKQKKKFVPDIIFLDYINIFTSSRYKSLSGVNSYSYIKAIAEEMRGLAVEFEVPIITATQLNRDGSSNANPDMTDTSESYGLPATADWMCAMVTNEDLQELNQQLFIKLKTRYGAKKHDQKRELVEVEFEKMRYYDINQSDRSEDDRDKERAVNDVKKNTKTNFSLTEDWEF
ncbi:MAG: DnaB-like helicase C-terminal domain-containing protein [Nitrosopumilaceae archaeon]|nr:DnaB-like helicase C-terminal domain-containing protein [Nitrosopumilaceae archaeon]